MAYTNSPLVDYICISPNRTKNRNHAIDTISIHCVVGQCSVKTLGNVFADTKKQASSNYGIGFDGQIGMYCEEKDRSWCTSSASNDHRAITIEVASDTKEPYAVTEAAYNSLIELLTDICKRNNIKELKWKDDKSLIGNVELQNMTVHKWFSNKSCPGTFLYKRHPQIAAEVNKRLGAYSKPASTPSSLKFIKGDFVQFVGGKQYKSSDASTGTSVKSCRAKITAISANAKHPYHCRAVDTNGNFVNGVYGWVDTDAVSTITSDNKPVTTKPATNNTTSTIKKGAIVSIMNNARYYNGTAIPSWVCKKTWVVKENPVGDRVVIDKSSDGKYSICSALSSKYLSVVSVGDVPINSTTTTSPKTTTSTIKKGSKVRVKSVAKTYTGSSLSSFVYKTTYTVLEEPKGDRVVIGLNGVVTAAVNKKDLTLA